MREILIVLMIAGISSLIYLPMVSISAILNEETIVQTKLG
jgi:hypothetical protein